VSLDVEPVTPVDTNGTARGQVDARFARLAAGVAGLGKATGRDWEKILFWAACAVAPLGVLLIVLGWEGAAHTSRLFEQVPYLISGGILGGSLVVFGGFLYFAYWLTKLVYEGRTQTRQLADLLTRIDARLETLEEPMMASVLLGSPETRAVRSRDGAPRAVATTRPGKSQFVATPTGTMYHRRDCAVVAGKTGLRPVPAGAAGFKPCRICDPEGDA
jgi:hypothetical protein